MSTIRRARDRRQYEASLIKSLYPSLSWRQISAMLRYAHLVRLPGGQTLESALGR
jgi:hypothetical protein